jgi:aspartate-semialdehyde dehydrogenase
VSPRARSTEPKPSAEWSALKRVAIVGAATLKGRELKDMLEERQFPAVDVKLLDDDESLGQLDAVGEEATFIQSVTAENFDGVDFAFFSSDAEYTSKHWQVARDAGATVIDMSYGLEQEQGAVVRSPWIEKELMSRDVLLPLVADASNLQITAHPVATVVALLLGRARRASAIRNAVITVFEPASEQGRRGMDELHQQTVNLLSFQQLPKKIFDQQVAFNVLSRYGAESPLKLEAIEQRILRHLRMIAPPDPAVVQPSIMLLQGPTFHSHTFSIFLELESNHSLGDFAQALAGEHVAVTHLPEEAPNNVSAAGQNDIQLALRRDAQRENAFWIWAASDNLRISALTAVLCAETSLRRQAIQ